MEPSSSQGTHNQRPPTDPNEKASEEEGHPLHANPGQENLLIPVDHDNQENIPENPEGEIIQLGDEVPIFQRGNNAEPLEEVLPPNEVAEVPPVVQNEQEAARLYDDAPEARGDADQQALQRPLPGQLSGAGDGNSYDPNQNSVVNDNTKNSPKQVLTSEMAEQDSVPKESNNIQSFIENYSESNLVSERTSDNLNVTFDKTEFKDNENGELKEDCHSKTENGSTESTKLATYNQSFTINETELAQETVDQENINNTYCTDCDKQVPEKMAKIVNSTISDLVEAFEDLNIKDQDETFLSCNDELQESYVIDPNKIFDSCNNQTLSDSSSPEANSNDQEMIEKSVDENNEQFSFNSHLLNCVQDNVINSNTYENNLVNQSVDIPVNCPENNLEDNNEHENLEDNKLKEAEITNLKVLQVSTPRKTMSPSLIINKTPSYEKQLSLLLTVNQLQQTVAKLQLELNEKERLLLKGNTNAVVSEESNNELKNCKEKLKEAEMKVANLELLLQEKNEAISKAKDKEFEMVMQIEKDFQEKKKFIEVLEKYHEKLTYQINRNQSLNEESTKRGELCLQIRNAYDELSKKFENAIVYFKENEKFYKEEITSLQEKLKAVDDRSNKENVQPNKERSRRTAISKKKV